MSQNRRRFQSNHAAGGHEASDASAEDDQQANTEDDYWITGANTEDKAARKPSDHDRQHKAKAQAYKDRA